MKTISLIQSAIFLLSTLVAAAPAVDQLLQQPLGGSVPSKVLSDDLSVPGSNPLFYCSSPDAFLLSIENVDLNPNPPLAGKNLTVKGSGSLKEQVENGAKVRLEVKYGLVKILTEEFDLCEKASVVDKKCPIDKGQLNLEKTVALPSIIPPGTYTVLASVVTKDETTITCLTASVTFSGFGSSSLGIGTGKL